MEVALSVLAEQQYRHILMLRNELNVLQEHLPAGLPPDAIMVAVSCSDGHRIKDIFDHHCEKHQCNIHLHALNGGALLLSDVSPENSIFPWSQGLIKMIGDSCELKHTNLVALGSHWPCAVAMRHNLEVDDVLWLTLHGRLLLKQAWERQSDELQREHPDVPRRSELEVYCFFHVAHLDGRPRTYSINHKHEHFRPYALVTVLG